MTSAQALKLEFVRWQVWQSPWAMVLPVQALLRQPVLVRICPVLGLIPLLVLVCAIPELATGAMTDGGKGTTDGGACSVHRADIDNGGADTNSAEGAGVNAAAGSGTTADTGVNIVDKDGVKAGAGVTTDTGAATGISVGNAKV